MLNATVKHGGGHIVLWGGTVQDRTWHQVAKQQLRNLKDLKSFHRGMGQNGPQKKRAKPGDQLQETFNCLAFLGDQIPTFMLSLAVC